MANWEAAMVFCLLTLNPAAMSYKILGPRVGRHDQGMKFYVSTSTVNVMTTVTSSFMSTVHNTCYTTDDVIERCQPAGEGVIHVEPNILIDGQPGKLSDIIFPSRVTKSVEAVYPDEVRVVDPVDIEDVSLIYPEGRQGPNTNGTVRTDDVDAKGDDVDNNNDDAFNVEENTVHLVEDFETTLTTTDGPMMSTPTTMMNLIEDEDVTTMASKNYDGRQLASVEDSFSDDWQEQEIIMGTHQDDDCFDKSNVADRFITVLKRQLSTSTHYETVFVDKVKTVLFKADNGGCLPTNVQDMFTSSCLQ